MKDTKNILTLILVLAAVVVGIIESNKAEQFHLQTISNNTQICEKETLPESVIEDETQEIIYPTSEIPLIRTSLYVNLTYEEMDLLESIAMAEAKGEGSLGMAYVMRVVLNRSRKYGKSIEEVIYAPGQFYTAGMGEEPSEACHEALAMVMDGWDESQGALFFNKYGYRKGCEALFQYGNHYFSK